MNEDRRVAILAPLLVGMIRWAVVQERRVSLARALVTLVEQPSVKERIVGELCSAQGKRRS